MKKNSSQRHALRRGNHRIAFELRRSSRARSRITVNVHHDCTVVVTAPRWASLSGIYDVVAKYADWIDERLQTFRAAGPPYVPEYRSGARHFYLGEAYTLKLLPVVKRRLAIGVDAGCLLVETRADEPEVVREQLRRWYREQARACFSERLGVLVAELPWVKRMPRWTLRRMRSQWGSCSVDGDISLNTHLIKATLSQIDYVLVHELCHIKHHDHGAGFAQLMDRHMPDWRERRRELNAVAHKLLMD